MYRLFLAQHGDEWGDLITKETLIWYGCNWSISRQIFGDITKSCRGTDANAEWNKLEWNERSPDIDEVANFARCSDGI